MTVKGEAVTHAVGSQAQGAGTDELEIRRYFTTEGVHPYDEIEWELRDAIIQNYRTGAVAFEQQGVEIPKAWSQNATNIAAQKYFRGTPGSPERERSVKQMIDRVVNRYVQEGVERGYFDSAEADIFKDELTHLLVTQKAAFNSPVWFNVGWRPKGFEQVSACFILSVEDEMDSILNWYVEEGRIFKHGSGAGVNLSKIRSSKERLRSGGTASGPVSFMRGADASAGTIKSGGATRRAAKMVVLNIDHPDIKDFIWCKALEERKARALREAGFDMDIDGIDAHSIQYQNANNSVRVTDDFMKAVVEDRDWHLKAVLTNETLETVKARELMRDIAQAAWECADPGLQYDTTINDWHTCPNSGPITASNPCFTGDSRVHTDKGLIRFDDLFRRVMDGETFEVYTHDATHPDRPKDSIRLSRPTQFMITGVNEITRLRFSDGRELKCTPNHRIWTVNRGWVRADELTAQDEIPALDKPTAAIMADRSVPVPTTWRSYAAKRDSAKELNLPEKWDEDLAHYMGWLIGDGSMGRVISTIYGSQDDRDEIMPRHLSFVRSLGVDPKPSVQPNGTQQVRISRGPLVRFFEALGVKPVRAAAKEVPWSLYEAPEDIVRAFLRGLFDADGCVSEVANGTRYVGLGSKSPGLLRGVQDLLSAFGIAARIYDVSGIRANRRFRYTRKNGEGVEYESKGASFDLRISGPNIATFHREVGFSLTRKACKLELLVSEHSFYRSKAERLAGRDYAGYELTYNLTEPVNHSYVVDGTVVSNCSEYLHVDDSACNLASLNLMKFVDENDNFDVDAYKHAVGIMFLAQEISVGFAAYPTKKIAENSHCMRQLGQGYANLGALLMAQGLPYDSDEGRAWAAAITALMTGHCYATSAKIAKRVGAFETYAENEELMLRVIGKHRNAAYEIPEGLAPAALVEAARRSWDSALGVGRANGYRNAQSSVIAPTGTIGLLMDCDTTGVEPDLALKKMKKLVGGGTMSIVNQTVPKALRKLGYDDGQIQDIIGYIDENSHVVGAPHLREEHMSVFDTAMGERSIHYMGHIKMMAAVQPFISGAISKTVNLPEDVTVEDVEQAYLEGWRRGLKALAIYRDNCKAAQPLSISKRGDSAEKTMATAMPQPVRNRLPKKRASKTIKFRVADTEGYLTTGEFPDGTVGEIFLKVAKQGSTLAGIMDAFAISISMGLQYGVPLSAYVKQFVNTRFEPSGMTDDPDFRIATSILDYVFRELALEYLTIEERHALGIRTAGERQGEIEARLDNGGNGNASGHGNGAPAQEQGVVVLGPVASAHSGSLPFCGTCGVQMQPAGSCFACPSCGSTSGCS
ncbi:MAG: ribonucleoside-diphosphate reductase [Actinomycetota bacterium]|nr:ribonucleoside-diphosphate reductase [Actinomycetota bacterium]